MVKMMNISTENRIFRSWCSRCNHNPTPMLDEPSIILSVIDLPPMVKVIRDPSGRVTGMEGYLAELWYTLQEQLNFSTVIIDAGPDYIGYDRNGTWTGMIGALQSNLAHVGLASLGITQERKEVIDFSAPVLFDDSKFLLFSGGRYQRTEWMTYIKTFSWKIWLCILVMWIVTSFILRLATRKETTASYIDYLFFLLGVIAFQASELVPKYFPGRLMFISYWAMCVVLNASFSALLTTILTTATYKPISSLKEALYEGFSVSLLKGTYQYQTILDPMTENEDFKRIAKLVTANPNLIANDIKDGVEKTLDKKTLFIIDTNMLLFETSTNCSFEILPPSYFSGYLHFAYSKKFQHKKVLDQRILYLMSTGVLNKLAIKYLPQKANCGVAAEGVPSLDLKKTSFAFVFLISGAILSFIIYVSEAFVNKYREIKAKKNETSYNSIKFSRSKIITIRRKSSYSYYNKNTYQIKGKSQFVWQ